MSRVLKRLLDLAVCAVAAPALLPVGVVVAIAVKVTSPGPVLYRAERLGRHGDTFTMLKFRTMAVGVTGPRVTAGSDPRITTVGRHLRRTKLDELPQLINVLRGEMSLVGPRPEDPAYLQGYHGRFAAVLDVRPGITGPASAVFCDEERLLAGYPPGELEARYVSEVQPAKLEIDLRYVTAGGVLTDVRILVDTVTALWGRARVERAAGPPTLRLPSPRASVDYGTDGPRTSPSSSRGTSGDVDVA